MVNITIELPEGSIEKIATALGAKDKDRQSQIGSIRFYIKRTLGVLIGKHEAKKDDISTFYEHR